MQESLDSYAPELFPIDGVDSDDVGYRAPVVIELVGVTYRQLDYWARTHLLEPSIRSAAGSGSQRLYSFRDLVVLRLIRRLLDAGISLQQVRIAIGHLRGRSTRDLAATTLMSNGTTVYECSSQDEVFDLLRGGQGVFGIAVGPALADLAGEISDFPTEVATDVTACAHPADELAARRGRRTA